MPRETNEQRRVVAEISGPEVLRVSEDGLDVQPKGFVRLRREVGSVARAAVEEAVLAGGENAVVPKLLFHLFAITILTLHRR